MADGKLQDPDLSAGAIVATEAEDDALAEGQVRRNDGLVLNPAAKNPWYVLATVAGEHKTTGFVGLDDDLAARNRRFWNGWACAEMDDADRAALAEDLRVPIEELAPLSEAERETLAAAFARRLGPDVPIPAPSDYIRCQKTHFPHIVVWRKCAFPAWADFLFATFSEHADFGSTAFSGWADFCSATFSGEVHFDSANFSGPAEFESTTFNEWANFETTRFSGSANFKSANFSGSANFKSANFSRPAEFDSATFSGPADFQSATFGKWANFSDGAFGARTVFQDVRFRGAVPEFYQREMHQDTSFTIAESHWPEITPENAEEGKRAYTRLRQLMLQLEKPDDAHFFFRQEMRCKAFTEDHWWNRVPITLFRWLSDYGYSVACPAAWLAIWLLLPGLIYLLHFAEWRISWADLCGFLSDLFSALGLSVANLFAFLGLHRVYFGDVLPGLPGWLQALAGAQTVAGVVLLFFLGLGLRNRFRLQ